MNCAKKRVQMLHERKYVWGFFCVRSDIFKFTDRTELDKDELDSTEMVVNGVWLKIAMMNRI